MTLFEVYLPDTLVYFGGWKMSIKHDINLVWPITACMHASGTCMAMRNDVHYIYTCSMHVHIKTCMSFAFCGEHCTVYVVHHHNTHAMYHRSRICKPSREQYSCHKYRGKRCTSLYTEFDQSLFRLQKVLARESIDDHIHAHMFYFINKLKLLDLMTDVVTDCGYYIIYTYLPLTLFFHTFLLFGASNPANVFCRLYLQESYMQAPTNEIALM